MASPFRTLALFFEALTFSVLVPGTVVAWIPLCFYLLWDWFDGGFLEGCW